ncbi:hypothetical protein BCR43DRAFT_487973 [Syncephalastrum racemosum]|uniref:18S rRNA factor 2 n=1 Tax=Syncephalastrum racemosum TaxID=13706 RepID=A0A1X2HHW4_SYNRA|nr:hypothetical protein BCR43DRAFT_487973 [Syncephalastrum racemosum]
MADQVKKDLLGLTEEVEQDRQSDSEIEQERDTRFSTRNLRKAHNPIDFEDSHQEDDSDSNDDYSGSDDSDSDNNDSDDDAVQDNRFSQSELQQEEGKASDAKTEESKRKRTKRKVKPLTPEELAKFEAEQKRAGVCYLSRIPPFMKPHRLKELLSKYAEVGRMHLVPEDPKITKRRKKYTKNRRINYVEGWVEFKDKKQAKTLAEHLNMKQIGGKRKSNYYHEMWTIKYLPKFKWNHLMEQITYEQRAREHKLRTEIAQATRENKAYLQNVEHAKQHKALQKKRKREDEADSDVKRTFKQREKVKRDHDATQPKRAMTEDMKSVLANVFS